MIHTPPNEWPLRGRFHCLDPASLTGLALAGAGGLIGGQALQKPPTTQAPAPTPPPAPAAPAQQPMQRAAATSQQPTFLGSAAVPQQSGSKSLLGQ